MSVQASYPSIRQSFKLVLVYLLIMGGVWLMLGMVREMLPGSTTNTAWYKDIDQILRYAIKMAIWIAVAWELKKKIDQKTPQLRFAKVSFGTVSLMFLIFFIFLSFLVLTLVAIVKIFGLDPNDTRVEPTMHFVALAYLRSVVLAPIFEEILFRGIMLEGLLENYKPPKAILVSAFIFGLVHFEPMTIVSAFAGGIFSGYIYYRYRSLHLCILLHALNNVLATTVIYFVP